MISETGLLNRNALFNKVLCASCTKEQTTQRIKAFRTRIMSVKYNDRRLNVSEHCFRALLVCGLINFVGLCGVDVFFFFFFY